jgi:hypothetical protein
VAGALQLTIKAAHGCEANTPEAHTTLAKKIEPQKTGATQTWSANTVRQRAEEKFKLPNCRYRRFGRRI